MNERLLVPPSLPPSAILTLAALMMATSFANRKKSLFSAQLQLSFDRGVNYGDVRDPSPAVRRS